MDHVGPKMRPTIRVAWKWVGTNSLVGSKCEGVRWIIIRPTFQKMDGVYGGFYEHPV